MINLRSIPAWGLISADVAAAVVTLVAIWLVFRSINYVAPLAVGVVLGSFGLALRSLADHGSPRTALVLMPEGLIALACIFVVGAKEIRSEIETQAADEPVDQAKANAAALRAVIGGIAAVGVFLAADALLFTGFFSSHA